LKNYHFEAFVTLFLQQEMASWKFVINESWILGREAVRFPFFQSNLYSAPDFP